MRVFNAAATGRIVIVSSVPLHLLNLPSSYPRHNMIDHSGIREIDIIKVVFCSSHTRITIKGGYESTSSWNSRSMRGVKLH